MGQSPTHIQGIPLCPAFFAASTAPEIAWNQGRYAVERMQSAPQIVVETNLMSRQNLLILIRPMQ